MVTLVLVNLISEMVGFIGGIITKARALHAACPLPCPDVRRFGDPSG